MIVARHLRIHGRVQGVFYRGWAVETARRLGLTGWVRNRQDGTVEARVQGEQAAVAQFLELAKDGPARAAVGMIEAAEAETDAGLDRFTRLSGD